jgi:ABC-type multidrug transport system ATPase subunit/pSer/pThr/pTyr-binding forkhead associated (FHA) protein
VTSSFNSIPFLSYERTEIDMTVILELQQETDPPQPFTFDQEIVNIGRAESNDLVLNDRAVSRYHARLIIDNERCFLVDLNSSGGTYINGELINPQQRWELHENDQVQMGKQYFRCQIRYQPDMTLVGGETLYTPSETRGTVLVPEDYSKEEIIVETASINLQSRSEFRVGRDPNNDQVIPHPSVSRFHARIERQNESFYITDLNSTNGTYVNGRGIQANKRRILNAGDLISIGPWRSRLNIDETLIVTNDEGNLRLDAVNLNKEVAKGVNLLNNISLSILEREFVVIAGVSGGGKSTLMDALNGSRPATSGVVFVNGMDLYRNYSAYRSQIGYVPQKDIVHTDLTVREALDFAAQLRMPADTTPRERQQRLDEVLKELGLSHRANVAIKALSGGQLKRVSIGVELITRPSLFFLDEATSGLDPGTEGDMMHLLRELADQGRTIILITHATENVTLCNQVVFLAKGGNLAYYGPPDEAVAHFEVERFNEIYRKVENTEDPTTWQEAYQQSSLYQEYVVNRQDNLPSPSAEPTSKTSRQPKSPQTQHISSWRQFWILTQRNLAIIKRDRASLILMLAIAPILGFLDFFTWQSQIFDTTTGDPGQGITMLFTAALIAVMVGSLSTMREIVKEEEIYRRERMIGLQLIPYLFSKVGVSVILALYQAAVFLLFKVLAVDLPLSFSVLSEFYLTLLLATLSGMVLGLLVSAIAPNQNIAPLLTIIVLVPQITFGGGVLPINTMGTPGLIINHLSLTKWSFESLVTITGLGTDVAEDTCWQLPEEKRETLTPSQLKNCDCFGKTVFKACEFPGIAGKYDPAVDEPEPTKPQEPSDPPSPPESPQSRSRRAQQRYEDELDQYQMAIDNYQEELDQYQEKVDRWQDDYSSWKEKYESAIGEAEGVIDRFYTDYGNTFAVNVIRHWSILTGLIVIMLGVLSGVQKRKDVI